MVKLTAAQRRNLSKSDYAIPEKAPGSGSFPIHDRKHARVALLFASRKGGSTQRRVRAAVRKKYPDMVKDS